MPFIKTPKQIEATRLHASYTHVMLYGGSRCVSGDTVLDGHTKTIKELSEQLDPIQVYTSHGIQIAEPPFKKGSCEMIKIETECGHSITVTPDHRFWKGSQWIFASSLEKGALVAFRSHASPQNLLQSNSVLSLSEFLSSVPRLKKKLEGCQGDCSEYPHQCDLQLRQFLAFFQAYRALQLYAQVHSRLDHCEYLRELNIHDLHLGLPELVCTQIDHMFLHLSMMDDFPSSYQLAEFSNPFFLQIYELFLAQLENNPIALERFYLPRSCELAFRSFFDRCGQFFFHDNLSCDTPSSNGYELRRVKLTTKTAKQDFYTLHVPNCQQYYANGFLNHNSGKTAIDIRNIVARALIKPSRHLVGRFRFNHVKQSIVYDTFPKVMELAFPSVKYTLNKSDWYVKFDNDSEIWFGGFDDKERTDKILGNEYSTIKLNECTQINWDTRNTVMSRLAENSGLPLLAMYDCNPTSRKHWTYTVFKKGETPDGEKIKNFDRYACLQMNPSDNVTNLPKEYLELLESLPERQRIRFLSGEFQDDIEGALWNALMLEQAKALPERGLKKTIIAVDPAVTNNEDSDLTGIIVCSLDENNDGVIHEDYSLKASPNTWIQRVINAYYQHDAAYVVVEVNQGGDMVETMIKNIDRKIKVVKVRASKGKFARAEPIAALYEQGRVRHEKSLPDLETEMCEYVPMNSKKSPDRLDALVWGLTDLMLQPKNKVIIPRGY